MDAVVKLGLNSQQLQSGIQQALATVKNMANGMQTAIKGIGALKGIQYVFSFGQEALEASAKMQSFQQQLKSVTKDSGIASAMLERLKVSASLPGVDLEAAVKLSTRLQAVGYTSEQARTLIEELGNAAALEGLSTTQLENVSDAIADIASSGDITDEKIDRLVENMSSAANVLQQEFGVTTAKGLRELGVTADQLIDRITTGFGKMERASTDTYENGLKKMADEIRNLKAAIGQDLMPVAIKALTWMRLTLQVIKQLWESMTEAVQTVKNWFGGDTFEDAYKNAKQLKHQEEQRKKEQEERLNLYEEEQKALQTITKAQNTQNGTKQTSSAQQQIKSSVVGGGASISSSSKIDNLRERLASEQKRLIESQLKDAEKLELKKLELQSIEESITREQNAGVVNMAEVLKLHIEATQAKADILSLERDITREVEEQKKAEEQKQAQARRDRIEELKHFISENSVSVTSSKDDDGRRLTDGRRRIRGYSSEQRATNRYLRSPGMAELYVRRNKNANPLFNKAAANASEEVKTAQEELKKLEAMEQYLKSIAKAAED